MARWSILPSLGLLVPVLLSIVLLTYKLHYDLPTPNTTLYDPVTNLPIISETAILEYARQLSEDIGYRTVGTREHALADKWMVDVANGLKEICDKKVGEGRRLECEVWRQEGSGSHRFDIMGKRVYKTYKNLSNIIMRISNGTHNGKEHAILINSHLDSTLTSPGAADDALAVGVMIETVRVLLETPDWEPEHAIIFLWNHAEESLQDASHLYSTQHETAKTVRAVINLEAAGTTGPALLFQATSKEMIEAYAHVPRPHGTVLANDIFSSGFLLSDTDFRQFEQYLNVTGLDMAIIGNSYLYHTRLDTVANIEAGAAQHMADQVLALIKYFSSIGSPLPNLNKRVPGVKPTTVYLSVLGRYYIMYSADAAVARSLGLLTTSIIFAILTIPYFSLGVVLRNFYAIASAAVGALVSANLVAFFMKVALNKPLSWFSNEIAPLFLYGPPALAGAVVSQLILPFERPPERSLLASVLILHALGASFFQMLFKLGSSQLLFVTALSQFTGLVYAYLTCPSSETRLSTYIVSELLPLIGGAEVFFGVANFFVPLTGRIGDEAPAEYIIASLVTITGTIALPTVVPFLARFSAATLKRCLAPLSLITVVSMAIFSMRSPFDAEHPKRVFILHSENVTSGLNHLHISAADSAPHFEVIVQSIADELLRVDLMNSSVDRIEPATMGGDGYNSDWDVLYPFSSFLTPYKLPLLSPSTYTSQWKPSAPMDGQFRIEITKDVTDRVKKTRKMELLVHHPGLILSVISFNAEVVSWSLDDHPPAKSTRHWIREGSFYGSSSYELSLEVRLSPEGDLKGSIPVNFVGIREDSMFPGKINDALNSSDSSMDKPGHAMNTLARLDAFLSSSTNNAVDVFLVGCVGGVVYV